MAASPDSHARGQVECRTLKPSFEQDIARAVASVATVWPVPPSLIKAIIQQESAFQPSAVSAAGAIGLMQVLPSNAARLGFSAKALFHPTDNILAGVRLLAVLLRHYQGDVISTLVAYNGRPRPALAPLPNNGETPAYVRAVLRFWTRYARCAAQRPQLDERHGDFPRGQVRSAA